MWANRNSPSFSRAPEERNWPHPCPRIIAASAFCRTCWTSALPSTSAADFSPRTRRGQRRIQGSARLPLQAPNRRSPELHHRRGMELHFETWLHHPSLGIRQKNNIDFEQGCRILTLAFDKDYSAPIASLGKFVIPCSIFVIV